MITSVKVRLEPNNKQTTKLFKSAGTARYIYNWTLAKQQENYKQGNKFISDNDLRKELTKLKQNELSWLYEVSNNIAKQAVKDACNTYKRFFKGLCKYPKYKSRKRNKPSFYNDCGKFKVKPNKVLIEKVGWVRISEIDRIPLDTKYYNPRIIFDGISWYISVGIDTKTENNNANDSIGIDLGIKDLAILSNGTKYKNINKSFKMKKLNKRKLRLQRKISKKYKINKKGECYRKTSNIVKLEKRLNKLWRRIANIRNDYIQKITTKIVKTKPSKIVMEDLKVSNMIKNHKLAKALQDNCLFEFKRQITYKCELNSIELILASQWFPSSKTCSHCGFKKPKLSLSERVFKCECCGFELDRDVNAAINLKNYT